MFLIIAVRLTPDKRPIEIAASLYNGDRETPVGTLRGFVRPEGWQVDTDPKVDRKYSKQGLPLVYFLWSLKVLSDCATVLVEWNGDEAQEFYAWAKIVTGKEFKPHPSVTRADLGMTFDGDMKPLSDKLWKLVDDGIVMGEKL